MERRFGLSIGTLAGAAILAFFVLAGALVMANSPTAGASTVQSTRTYQLVVTTSNSDMTQGTELAIVPGDQGTAFNQSSVVAVPEGNTLVVRNMTSQEQVVTVAGTSGCHTRHMGVRSTPVEPGSTTTLSFYREGSYTVSLQSDPGVQLAVNVGDD